MSVAKLPDSPRAALEAFIQDLGTTYSPWYDSSVGRLRKMTLSLRWSALLSGVVASIVAAIFTQKGVDMPAAVRPIVIVLPTIGSLLTGLIVQGKLVERYRLRVDGQLAFQSLVNEAKERFARLKTDEEISAYHQSLLARVDAIEEKQSVAFFDLLKVG
jgi:hypothetical protein